MPALDLSDPEKNDDALKLHMYKNATENNGMLGATILKFIIENIQTDDFQKMTYNSFSMII